MTGESVTVEIVPEDKSYSTDPRYQYFPAMAHDDFTQLKESIAKRGPLPEFPVVVDEVGKILDGHHRSLAYAEMGLADYPVIHKLGMTEAEKDDYIWSVNIGRRHLTLEQKRDLIRHRLKSKPEASDREIAREVGVDHKTVSAAREVLQETGEIPQYRAEGGRGVTTGKVVDPADFTSCAICSKPVRKDRAREINGLTGHPECLPVADAISDTPGSDVGERIAGAYFSIQYHYQATNPTVRYHGVLPYSREREWKVWEAERLAISDAAVDAPDWDVAVVKETARQIIRALRERPWVGKEAA
jgi:hypothetical protein